MITQDERFELRRTIALTLGRGENRKVLAKRFGVRVEVVDRAAREYVYTIIADLINTSDTIREIALRHNRNPSMVWRIYEECIRCTIPVQERRVYATASTA